MYMIWYFLASELVYIHVNGDKMQCQVQSNHTDSFILYI